MMQADRFHIGKISLEQGKLDEAFLHLVNAIDTNPLAYLLLSEVVAKEGNLSHALYLLEQAMAIPRYFNPIFEERYEQLLVQKKEIEKQEKIKFKKEKEKEKERVKKEAKQKLAEEYFQKGEAVLQQQAYSNAIGFYQQALEQNSQHWNAHLKFNQAIQKCEFNEEKIKSALKSCDIMIGLASSVEHHKDDLALAYCEKGNAQFFLAANQANHSAATDYRKQAQKNYERAIKEDASFSRAYFGLAKCFMRQATSKRDELLMLNDAEVVELYKKADTYFMQGLEAFGIGDLPPPDICWELGQLKDAQGDVMGGQKYYAMAFQGNGEIYCTLYLDMVDKEFPLGAPDLLTKYSFILHNQDFHTYLMHCNIPGERAGLYCRSATLNGLYHRPLLAIQQALLALVFNETEEQSKFVFQLLSGLESNVDHCIFENINNELSALELVGVKAGYIHWIEQNLAEGNYQGVIKKYAIIKDNAAFKVFLPASFLANMGNAYAKIKNLEDALVCYQRAAVENPDDVTLKDKIEKLAALQILRAQAVLPVLSAEEKLLAQGNEAYHLKNYRLALETYQQVLVINAAHGRAHVGAAKCYRQIGEAMIQPDRFKIVSAAEGAGFLRQVELVQSEDEKECYEKSEEHFHSGLGLITHPFELAEIYQELGYLSELQGYYRKAFAYFEMSYLDDKEKFYDFYRELTSREFPAQPLYLIYRFDFLLHDEGFEAYYFNSTHSDNIKSGMYHSCGYVYECNGQLDSAIQQYLLAAAYNKESSKTQNIYQSMDKVLEILAKFGKKMNASIFENTFTIATAEELLGMKRAYIKWMQRDLNKKDYNAAVDKFMLLAGDPFSHSLMGAKFLCHMGVACVESDLDLAVACYEAAVDVDPTFEKIEPNRTVLLHSKTLRDQKRAAVMGVDIYSASRVCSSTLYNKCTNNDKDEYNEKSSCNPF